MRDVRLRERQKEREEVERELVAKKVGKRSRFLRSVVSTLPWELVHFLCSQPSLRKQPTPQLVFHGMTSEERLQEFHADDLTLSRSGQ